MNSNFSVQTKIQPTLFEIKITVKIDLENIFKDRKTKN